MLTTFAKDLRLLLRDPIALSLSLLAPLVMITVITLARSGSSEPPRPLVPVVDLDKGPVAGAFIALLKKHADVVEIDQPAAEHLVADLNRAPAAIVFPRGLSKSYLQGRSSEIELLTDPAQAIALNSVRALLLVMDRDAAELADPLHEDLLVYRDEPLTDRPLSPKAREQNVPGFTIMFILLAVVLGTASMMHDERTWGTLTRLQVAPAGFASILAGKLGARMTVGFLQGMLLLGWGWLMLDVSLGQSLAGLALLTAATAFAAAALGMLVAGGAATQEQTLPMSLAATLGLSAIGGLWWPISLVPEWLRLLGQAFFPTWSMYGMADLILRERGFAAVLGPLTIIVGQGVLLLAIGIWLFRRRHA